MKKLVHSYLKKKGYKITRVDDSPKRIVGVYHEKSIETEFKDIINSFDQKGYPIDRDVPSYTMYTATKYVIENGIDGDFIECGVGDGNKLAIASALCKKRGITDYQFYLYDTFAGMTEPSEHDYKNFDFKSALNQSEVVIEKFNRLKEDDHNKWCYYPLEKVKDLIALSDYPQSHFHFIKGNILETIPNSLHKRIALLRLDTDWYESSYHELIHLYDLVVEGGVIIFDDYGAWHGQKLATDRFFEEKAIKPLLMRTCLQERLFVKGTTPRFASV